MKGPPGRPGGPRRAPGGGGSLRARGPLAPAGRGGGLQKEGAGLSSGRAHRPGIREGSGARRRAPGSGAPSPPAEGKAGGAAGRAAGSKTGPAPPAGGRRDRRRIVNREAPAFSGPGFLGSPRSRREVFRPFSASGGSQRAPGAEVWKTRPRRRSLGLGGPTLRENHDVGALGAELLRSAGCLQAAQTVQK